jgi:uncharacterized membrane protein
MTLIILFLILAFFGPVAFFTQSSQKAHKTAQQQASLVSSNLITTPEAPQNNLNFFKQARP